MRLTFYLYEPPAKAMFKVVGPLFLVLYLMLMNFNEFYGLRNIWDNGCPGEERDSDYLANGIGIAITAAFVVPAIRADRMKSPYIRWGLAIEYLRLYATYPRPTTLVVTKGWCGL
ncbi:unnamed protein product [Ectocarpus sp. 12 AP-2014]